VDYVRFLRTARGSLYEINTHLLIASRLGYLRNDSFKQIDDQIAECGRILIGLIRSLEAREPSE